MTVESQPFQFVKFCVNTPAFDGLQDVPVKYVVSLGNKSIVVMTIESQPFQFVKFWVNIPAFDGLQDVPVK